MLGRRATARRPDELLTEITLGVSSRRTGDVYLKVGRRSAMEVAIVGLAMRLRARTPARSPTRGSRWPPSLAAWTRASTVQAGLAQRTRILLLAAEGVPHGLHDTELPQRFA